MVNALAATFEESRDEPVRRKRSDEFDLSAVRETELRPDESLLFTFAGEEKNSSKSFSVKRDRFRQIANGDRDVIDGGVEHVAQFTHDARMRTFAPLARIRRKTFFVCARNDARYAAPSQHHQVFCRC
jgi:hypothetical protein